jgi:hypothetical protein
MNEEERMHNEEQRVNEADLLQDKIRAIIRSSNYTVAFFGTIFFPPMRPGDGPSAHVFSSDPFDPEAEEGLALAIFSAMKLGPIFRTNTK